MEQMPKTFTKELLTKTIIDVSKEWLYDENDFVCYWDVNSGSCGEFALAVLNRLPENSGVVLKTTEDYLDCQGLESYGEQGEYSYHVWLYFNGEHFDIERPYGVNDFLKLPYFQREKFMFNHGINEMELYDLLTDQPDKYKELKWLSKIEDDLSSIGKDH